LLNSKDQILMVAWVGHQGRSLLSTTVLLYKRHKPWTKRGRYTRARNFAECWPVYCRNYS